MTKYHVNVGKKKYFDSPDLKTLVSLKMVSPGLRLFELQGFILIKIKPPDNLLEMVMEIKNIYCEYTKIYNFV
jgi:hypothetical protein